MDQKEFATLGGKATLKKYGKEYFRQMGIRSGKKRRNKKKT